MTMHVRIKILKEKGDNLTGDDVREGLTAIISVKHQTHSLKVKPRPSLETLRVVKITNRLFSEALSRFLLENLLSLRRLLKRDFGF